MTTIENGYNIRTHRVGRPLSALALALCGLSGGISVAQAGNGADTLQTTSPIKHVIVVIAENYSFDYIYGTYQAAGAGQSVGNLLSRGIVNADGTPGPNFARSAQYKVSAQPAYYISAPLSAKTPYATLPAPGLNDLAENGEDSVSSQFQSASGPPPFATAAFAAQAEPFLLTADLDKLLTTGASGLPPTNGADSRIANYKNLPNGPFQLTAKDASGKGLSYDSYSEDTIHRFYQNWQQHDCDISHRTAANPSGCLKDLFPFVTTSFLDPLTLAYYQMTAQDAGQGTAMAFLNVQNGDAPYLKSIADQYTLSDNYHQAVMGGTFANHVEMMTGDMFYWSDSYGQGTPASLPVFTPATAPSVWSSLPLLQYGITSLTPEANPNPVSGSNNQYSGDLLASLGAFTRCDPANPGPGASAILSYLQTLPYNPAAKCAASTYYMVNNFYPYFRPDGTAPNPSAGSFTDLPDLTYVPPQTVPTVADALTAKSIPWTYYGDGYAHALAGDEFKGGYCWGCNAMQYTRNFANPTWRQTHFKDSMDLVNDINQGTVPAVSFLKPTGFVDGHPQSSKLDLFEAFLRSLMQRVNAQPGLAADTAIIVTWDESGGFYDSGFVQPVDFFGDGPRIPTLVISPYSQGGRVVHTYYDHVSILKFIERNWGLSTLSTRSRDNLPNPVHQASNPYVPQNMPAIGDLFDMFQFQ